MLLVIHTSRRYLTIVLSSSTLYSNMIHFVMYFISDENGAAIPMPNIFTGEKPRLLIVFTIY